MWRARREPGAQFLLAWLIPSWIVFEVVLTKLPHYVLYGMAPLVLLMARLWADVAHERWRGWGVCAALLVLSALALLGLTAAAPQLAARLQASTADAHWQTLLAAAAAKAAPATGWLALAALLVLGLACWLFCSRLLPSDESYDHIAVRW